MSKAAILIIEDSEEVRENLSEILELYGYEVTSAPNGLEGVKAAINKPPDLILCDVMMPELDGYGVLNLINENPVVRGTPFIFITAKSETEDIRRGMNLGADDYITKPFYKDELLNVITTRLKKAEGRGSADAAVHLFNPEHGYDLLISTIEEQSETISLGQGQTIAREGDLARHLYYMVSGNAHCVARHDYGRDFILNSFYSGDLLGLVCLLEGTRLNYSIKAMSDEVKIKRIERQQLLELMDEQHAISHAITHLLTTRLVEQGKKLVHQAYDSVRRRTALIICELHQHNDGSSINFTRDELAQMIGTTKESVSRTISELKNGGFLEVEGRSLQVVNYSGLLEWDV